MFSVCTLQVADAQLVQRLGESILIRTALRTLGCLPWQSFDVVKSACLPGCDEVCFPTPILCPHVILVGTNGLGQWRSDRSPYLEIREGVRTTQRNQGRLAMAVGLLHQWVGVGVRACVRACVRCPTAPCTRVVSTCTCTHTHTHTALISNGLWVHCEVHKIRICIWSCSTQHTTWWYVVYCNV